MEQSGSKGYYPMMLDISGKPCVIVGGGAVAERKAGGLLEAGAAVTIISPSCTGQIEQWAELGMVTLIQESYRDGMPELLEAFLIFAATDQAEINAAVRLEAESLGKLVTVADDSARSGFIVPAVVRRGKLVIAISTEGASPGVAKKVKHELEQVFGEEYGIYLELLQELRRYIQALVSNTSERQEMFKHMLDWELLPWIRSGQFNISSKRELMSRIEAEPTAAGIKQLERWIRGVTE